MQKIKDLEETLQANELMMMEQEKSFEERLLEEQQREAKLESNVKDLSVPYLTNLNEDPLLSSKIYHNMTVKDKFLIGKLSKDSEIKPDIVLRGIGIQE